MTRNGFTLVELLAALAVGSLLLAGVGAITGQFGDRLRRTKAPDAFERIADIAVPLTGLIEQASPSPEADRAFLGDATHLSAEIAPPLALGAAGAMRLELEVARATDGTALDLALSPIHGRTLPPLLLRRRLISGLRGITFRYLDDVQPGHLPRLITIVFGTKTGQTWELAIEPKARTAATCRFDPISLTCRA